MELLKNNQRSLQLYNGYCKMPLLWKGELNTLKQFKPDTDSNTLNDLNVDFGNTRLGKLAEKLFSIWIEKNDDWKIIFENLQIFNNKNTIGELDICLQNLKTNKFYHIELVTKFYLYDPRFNFDDVGAWVGPNKNDSLANKIAKLKNKQLPLFFNNLTLETLDELKIPISDVLQRVYFKAWLFVPLNFKESLITFNTQCIGGFYMDLKAFISYSKDTSNFYVPSKQDWLRFPETQEQWFSFSEAMEKINIYIKANKAALVWMNIKGKYERIMITPYSQF